MKMSYMVEVTSLPVFDSLLHHFQWAQSSDFLKRDFGHREGNYCLDIY